MTEWQCRSAAGFGILIDDPGVPSTSTPPITTDGASTTRGGSSVLSTTTGDPANGGNGNENASQPAPVGAIVGGVIGGLAVIGLGIVGALLIMRRRRQQSADPAYSGGPGGGPNVAYAPAPGGGYGPPGAQPNGALLSSHSPYGGPPSAHEYYAPTQSSHSPGQSAVSPYTPMVGVPAGYPPVPSLGGSSASPPHDDPTKMYPMASAQQWGGGAFDPRMQQGPQAGYSQVTPPPQQHPYYPAGNQGHNAELDGAPALGSYGNRAELRG